MHSRVKISLSDLCDDLISHPVLQEVTGELGTIQVPHFKIQNTKVMIIQYRGRRLVREAVSRLVGNKPVQNIVFGGTSAGGRGSMVTPTLL